GRSNGIYFICYLILASGMFWFCLVLGNKSELFAAGVAGTLFYMANSKRPRLLRLIIIGMIGLVGLWLIDFLRSVPLRQLLASVSELKFSDWLEAVSFISSSNEAFGAHFSMYGVLSNGLYPTYGSSIVSLVASIIPRIVWSNRPADIYLYYSEGVDASVGQGYSIHHATGWYLNYGVLGIIIGGILLASVWAFCFNFSRYYKIKKPYWLYVFSRIAPWTFVASIPALVRGGPEAYKGLFIDGFLIPVMVLSFASLKLRVKRVS
ncbi:MAG: hypothetical protein ACE5FU_12810, partial [Nitrospinota bacterium]